MESKTLISISKPKPDGGWGWIIVFGSFMLSVIGDGFAYTSGLFYYEWLLYYKKSEFVTAFVPSLMTGMILLCGPIASGLERVYGCRFTAILGSVIATAGMVLSVIIADSIYYQWINIGLITGTGLGLIYLPQMIVIGYWFEKRFATATGIAICGSGLGIAIFAAISDPLIDHFEWKGAMLILAAIMFTGVAFSALFRDVDHSNEQKSFIYAIKLAFDCSLLCDVLFDYFLVVNFVIGAVYYVPIIFLKDHVMTTNTTTEAQVVWLFVCLGLSNCVGRAVFGFVGDIQLLSRSILFAFCEILFGISMAIMIIPREFKWMLISVIILGVIQGASVCLASVALMDIFGAEKYSNAFGILCLFWGVATMIGPPIVGLTVDEHNKSYVKGILICAIITIIGGVLLLLIPFLKRKLKYDE